MSAEYKDQDIRSIAQAAERDLNSHSAKHGHGVSDTGNPSLLRTSTQTLLTPFKYSNLVWMQE